MVTEYLRILHQHVHVAEKNSPNATTVPLHKGKTSETQECSKGM